MATRPETAKKFLLHWMDGTAVLLGIFYGSALISATAQAQTSMLVMLTALACMAGVLVLFSLVLRDAYDDRPPPTVKLTVAALLAVVAALLPVPHPPEGGGTWESVIYIWLGAAVLYLPLRVIIGIGAVLLTAMTAYVSATGPVPWQAVLVSHLFSAALLPVGSRIWYWLWRTIRDAHDSQEAKARLAVSEERLRFARDLHDLLGHSLSVITLKSELSAKMATKDPVRAASEMSEVRRLAGESLIEVQVAVDGYRSLDLDKELAGARAALEAAGATCTIDARAEDLSPPARILLAWAIREGATNVLKHSRATWCSITIDGGVLEMRNDGVHAPDGGTGSGLRGLAERMSTAGGSFSASPTRTGEFLLRARVPA